MSRKYLGRHVRGTDFNKPTAWGVCDYTGFDHLRKDLVKQMQWVGQSLVWTGLYVGKDYVDEPNAQMKTIILPQDPIPVKEPRPPDPPDTDSPDVLPIAEAISSLTSYNWGS